VCGSGNTKAVAPFRFKNPVFTGCSRAVCADCGMVFASPMPSEAALSAYNASYFSTAHGGQPTSPLVIAFSSGIARLRLAFVKRFLGRHQIAVERVLELGPGPGYFAKSWMEQSPNSVYSVVETDSSCHESLRVLGASLVGASDIVPTDLVVMSHVLEHVSDPMAFVSKATRGLRRGGALFIEVPCRDWEHKALDEPHVLFFDKKPMQQLLEKLGFGDIEVAYYGRPVSELRSESWLYAKLMAVRGKLIAWGVVAPFSRNTVGLESLNSPLERAMLHPFCAHRECAEPAWWLRASARKL
jgi:SAM-dependent methyltransferase